MDQPSYEQPSPWTRADAERAFSSTDPRAVCNALVGVTFHEPDRRWLENWLSRLATHPDVGVRATVATCIGHVARIHGAIDPMLGGPTLDALARDPVIAGRVQDARDDIAMFVRAR